MNILSLFDGVSCGQIALERAGIKVDTYYASEIDKYAIQITQKNYPNTIQLGDINNIHFNEYIGKIDLLIGGSPCQGFSFVGQQLNFNDPRSRLFFNYVEALNIIKPKYFLFENVRMKKEYQDIISTYLEVQPILINSDLVSAQGRNRFYWTNIPDVQLPEDKNIYVSDIIENQVEEKYFVSDNFLNNYLLKKRDKQWFTFKPVNLNGKARTVQTKVDKIESNYIYDNNRVRKLTPLECERLQTLPDNYTEGLSNTQRYKCIGNGWTVDVITHILKNIK